MQSKNVIHANEVLYSGYLRRGHISKMVELCKQTGYPYFEWNGIVYANDGDDGCVPINKNDFSLAAIYPEDYVLYHSLPFITEGELYYEIIDFKDGVYTAQVKLDDNALYNEYCEQQN